MKLTEYLSDIGRPVAFYPSLRKITGSTTATLFLCQMIYWIGKGAEDGWIYKVSSEIEEETGLSYKEQKTARDLLVSRGILEERNARLEHRIYFRVNLEKMDQLWEERTSGNAEPEFPETPGGTFGNTPEGVSLIESENTPENKSEISMDELSQEINPELSDEKKDPSWKLNERQIRLLGAIQAGYAEHEKRGSIDLEKYPSDTLEIIQAVSEVFALTPPTIGGNKAFWISGSRELLDALQGEPPLEVMKMIKRQIGSDLMITSPKSLVNLTRREVGRIRADHGEPDSLEWDPNEKSTPINPEDVTF